MTTEAAARSRQVAAIFDRAAATYESVGVPWFAPIAEHLVRELALQPGERVLDIGCGRGAVSLPAADAVGVEGQVTAIDLSEGMVEALRAQVRERGLTSVDVQLMDASAPTVPDPVDVIASSLVVFFLPDPSAGALRRWFDLVRPGGRVGITTFGPQDSTWIAVDGVFAPYLPQQMLDARTSGLTGAFASDEGVEGLLGGAGFVGARTVNRDVAVHFADVDEWERWSWSHGQRMMWEFVPEPERQTVKARAADLLEAARDDAGRLTLVQTVRYTLASRP